MPDLAQLRKAEAAIGAAGSAPELEELRVRYLGRKSELTQALRSIGELPPSSAARSASRPTRCAQRSSAPRKQDTAG